IPPKAFPPKVGGQIVFYKTRKSKIGISLLIVSILFSTWCIFDLILWATNRPDIVMFFWSLQILVEPLVYLMCFYLVYLFVKNRDLSFKWKLLGIFLYSPIVLLLSFQYNLQGVNLADCTAIEGFIAQYFTYIIESIFILSIVVFTAFEVKKISNVSRRKEIIIFGLGILLFLIAFSSGNIIGSFTENWTLAQAGLIGMPVFIGFLAYLIVRFHTFNIKLIATQALVFALGFLVIAILFIRKIENVRIVVILTLLFVIALGYALVRSVKVEVQQREELEKLNVDLQNLLKQREALVHLVTHKVKGSFTRSKYIFAELLEGAFGVISPEMKDIAEKGLRSDNEGIKTVDLVLSAANLQGGKVKYDMKPIDFKKLTEEIVNSKKEQASQRGLKLKVEIKAGSYNILGDAPWLKEAAQSFVDNALKYTLHGSVTVGLEKRNDKVIYSVKDTGVGLTADDKQNLFKEGGRGQDSLRINVDSTGYGLYSAKMVIEAHQGRCWAESAGQDKGSTFFLELP